jgi:hypothetical protein
MQKRGSADIRISASLKMQLKHWMLPTYRIIMRPTKKTVPTKSAYTPHSVVMKARPQKGNQRAQKAMYPKRRLGNEYFPHVAKMFNAWGKASTADGMDRHRCTTRLVDGLMR